MNRKLQLNSASGASPPRAQLTVQRESALDQAGQNSSSQQPQPQQSQPQPQLPSGAQPQPGQTTQTDSASQPNQGQFSPGSAVDPVETGARPIQELRREWGNLPLRVRQELSESLNAPYSPSHREQTETYFRVLADLEEDASR